MPAPIKTMIYATSHRGGARKRRRYFVVFIVLRRCAEGSVDFDIEREAPGDDFGIEAADGGDHHRRRAPPRKGAVTLFQRHLATLTQFPMPLGGVIQLLCPIAGGADVDTEIGVAR